MATIDLSVIDKDLVHWLHLMFILNCLTTVKWCVRVKHGE